MISFATGRLEAIALMWNRYKNVAPPAFLAVAMGIVAVLSATNVIPPPGDSLTKLGRWLGGATPIFIAACALLENTVGFNSYFPGAFVILYSMAATHGHIARAMVVFGAIAAASLLAQHVNYAVGLAWPSQKEERRRALMAGFLSYWHPQLGAIYSCRLGLRGATYREFLTAMLSWLSWTIFWGVLMYWVGNVPVSGSAFGVIFVLYVAGWLIVEILKARRSNKERAE